MPSIEFRDVTKRYGKTGPPAVENISLIINKGEKIGLIGANGSGKTTLLRLLLNFVRPDSGTITVFGENDLEKARKYIGYLPERQEGLENFTPRELLSFAIKMNGNMPNIKTRIETLLAFANLSEVADDLLTDFSKGMWQRVMICAALAHQPQILLLDEPMSGLDPEGQKSVRSFIGQLKDMTIIYASHNLTEIQDFCDTVVIIHEGSIIEKLSLQEIQQEIFLIETIPAARAVVEKFEHISPTVLAENDNLYRIRFTASAANVQQLIGQLSAADIPIQKLRSQGVLENLYHQYVTQATEIL